MLRRPRLEGEVAIITGSSGGGTGTAMARVFAEEGARVVVTGRNESRGAAIAKEIVADGGEAVFIRADLCERADCERLVQGTVGEYGSLTVLVNNATGGGGTDGTVVDISDEWWERAWRVNVTAVVWLCRYAIPKMRSAGYGSIVNITSRTAIRGTPNIAAYTACKGAVTSLTRSIAMDFSREGIRCNTVAPGFITDKERGTGFGPEIEESVFQPMHLTRMPSTVDVAMAALYLASRESESVTGILIPVDGGGTQVRGATLG